MQRRSMDEALNRRRLARQENTPIRISFERFVVTIRTIRRRRMLEYMIFLECAERETLVRGNVMQPVRFEKIHDLFSIGPFEKVGLKLVGSQCGLLLQVLGHAIATACTNEIARLQTSGWTHVIVSVANEQHSSVARPVLVDDLSFAHIRWTRGTRLLPVRFDDETMIVATEIRRVSEDRFERVVKMSMFENRLNEHEIRIAGNDQLRVRQRMKVFNQRSEPVGQRDLLHVLHVVVLGDLTAVQLTEDVLHSFGPRVKFGDILLSRTTLFVGRKKCIDMSVGIGIDDRMIEIEDN